MSTEVEGDYSLFDLAKFVGRKHTAIREWYKKGHLPLSKQQQPKGRGLRISFSKTDVARLMLFDVLLATGFHASAASAILREAEFKPYQVSSIIASKLYFGFEAREKRWKLIREEC